MMDKQSLSSKNLRMIVYYLPGVYTFSTRIKPEGILKSLLFHCLGYVITVLPIPLFLLEVHHIDYLSALAKYTVGLILGFILLYTVYEMLYLINDFFAVKRESIPTLRASHLTLNPYIFIVMRTLLTIGLLILSLILDKTTYIDKYVMLALIIAVGLLHNSLKNKFARSITHASLRILRFSFPTCYTMGLNHLPAMFISLFPIVLRDEISYYTYNLSKLIGSNFKHYQELRIPLYITLATYMPLQVVLLKELNSLPFILGNVSLCILSLMSNVKRSYKS